MNFGTLGIGFGALGRGGAGVAEFTPASLYSGGYSGDYWDPADLTKLFQLSTGSTAVAVADDPVGYMGGQRGSHNFTQSSATLRPLYKGSAFTGNLSFDDSDDAMSVATSQALFKYLHDGTGGSFWIIGNTPTGEDKRFFGSKNSTSTATIGFLLTRLFATSRPQVLIANGSANVISLTPGSGTPWPADTPTMICVTYSTADGCRIYANGVEVATGTDAAAPSTSNSNNNLALAPTATVASPDTRACGVINRVLTPAEVLALYEYYSARGSL